MISTPINEQLGIQYPIFQGGMAWVADASLASAVSNAGGLGIIAAMNSNGEQLRAEIQKCKTLTDKPFGVNIMLMSPFVEETAKVVAEEKIPVVTTGAGNPARFMPMWLEAGIKVIPVTPSTTLAKIAQKNGAFAVIAEGGESGGHVGDGIGSSDLRCSNDSCYCGRGYCGRQRNSRFIYVGCSRCSGWYTISGSQRMYHKP